jgi:hypothetical protein
MSDDADTVSRMAEMTVEQRLAFDAARRSLERLAACIGALPLEDRERAIAAACKSLENSNRGKGYEGHPATKRWLNEYITSLRTRVAAIAVSGGKSVAGGLSAPD